MNTKNDKNQHSKQSENRPLPLTSKEKAILEFIEVQLAEQGMCPSYMEIKNNFGFASINSVQNYIKQLEAKNYIRLPKENAKRSIQILHSSKAVQENLIQLQPTNPNPNRPNKSGSPRDKRLLQAHEEILSLPLLGRVAAGVPIEAHEHDEFLDVPPSMVRYPSRTFALKVEGQSMIEEGILDGDIVLVQTQNTAENGDVVVAIVDNSATVKKFFKHKNPPAHLDYDGPIVELRPANSKMKPMWHSPDEVEITGIVVGLIRRF